MEEQTTPEETGSLEYEEPLTSEAEPEETPEPEVHPEPVVETQPAPQMQYTSPYAGQPAPSDVPDEYAQVFDPQVYKAINKMANEIADKKVSLALQAQAQQQAAARQLGLPDTAIAEYGDAMQRYGHQVPEQIRGTAEGAKMAFAIALGEKIVSGQDVGDVLRRATSHFQPKGTEVAQQQVTREVIPPENRMTSTRSNTTVRTTPVAQKGPYSFLKATWGMTDEEERELRNSGDAVIAGARR